jgi:hypothetical protein
MLSYRLYMVFRFLPGFGWIFDHYACQWMVRGEQVIEYIGTIFEARQDDCLGKQFCDRPRQPESSYG